MRKQVIEDWTAFNRAVLRRRAAARAPDPVSHLRRPTPVALPTPPAPAGGFGGWGGMAAVLLLAVLVVAVAAVADGGPAPAAAAAAAGTGGGGERVLTNYTTFHRVEFLHGAVVTGWRFGSSRAAAPEQEHCYFEVQEGDARRIFDIESRPAGGRLPYPAYRLPRLSRDQWEEAASRCRWHHSSRPARPAAGGAPDAPAPPATPAPGPATPAPPRLRVT